MQADKVALTYQSLIKTRRVQVFRVRASDGLARIVRAVKAVRTLARTKLVTIIACWTYFLRVD